MAVDILDPIYIINQLFGNMWLFAAVSLIGYLYIAARYRFNIQLTAMGGIAIVLMAGIIPSLVGFTSIFPFIIVGIGLFLAYVIWRFMATK